jgi:flagellar biosynthesis protein FlhA
MNPTGGPITLPGEPTVEPTFGLEAMWVQPIHRLEAEEKNYTIVDPLTVITTHISEIIKDNTSELFTFADTQNLLDRLEKPHQKLLADIMPAHITTAGLQRIFQNLLKERVSIRDMETILEAISEICRFTNSIQNITEHVRTRLARQLCAAHSNDQGILDMVTLSPDWEHTLTEALTGEGDQQYLALPPTQLQQFSHNIQETFHHLASKGQDPVLLTSGPIRPHVRSILERIRPQTVVMSQNEIHHRARIHTLTTLNMS